MTTGQKGLWSGYGLAAGETGSGYGKKGAAAAPAGASLWTLVGADGGVGTAPASDLNDWTCYISASMSQFQDYNGIAYGKDGNGDGLWVAVNANGNREIRYSSDPSVGVGSWADVSPNAVMIGVAWGDDVWITVGKNGKMWRSTAGTSGWSRGQHRRARWLDRDRQHLRGRERRSGRVDVCPGHECVSLQRRRRDLGPRDRLLDRSGPVAQSACKLQQLRVFHDGVHRGPVVRLHAKIEQRPGLHRCCGRDRDMGCCHRWGTAPETAEHLRISGAQNGRGRRDGHPHRPRQTDTSRSTDGGQDWTKYTGNYPGTGLLPDGPERPRRSHRRRRELGRCPTTAGVSRSATTMG